MVIEGLDGSGKSYTARHTAQDLSELYPRARIGMADSTGLYDYRAGQLVSHKYPKLECIEPVVGEGRLKTVARLGAFTLTRKLIDYQGLRRSDLLISVRDPQRVDPATYSTVYHPGIFGRMSAASRLEFFDRFTNAEYPDAIVDLIVSPERAAMLTAERVATSPHETIDSLEKLSIELPAVLHAYTEAYGVPVLEVEGGLKDTVAAATDTAERLLASV